MTREGGSIPVTLTLQEATGKNVMLLPLGACDDGAHSQNEKMDRKNYIEGVSIVVFFIKFAIEMIRRRRPRFPQWTRGPTKTSCNNPRSFSPYELGSVHVYVKRFYIAKR